MSARLYFCLVGLFLAEQGPLFAGSEIRLDEKGTYLGILFSPRSVPAPAVRQNAPPGVVITHVLPNSPAELAHLQRGDIILRYAQTSIRNTEHLTGLICADRPDRTVTLVIQRNQRLRLVDVKLALGPALKPAPAANAAQKQAAAPAVSIWAAPLESGKVRLTIEYQPVGGQKKITTCEGEGNDLAEVIEKLPQREQSLVRIALERLNGMSENKAKPAAKKP